MAAESNLSVAATTRGRTIVLVSSDGHEFQLLESEASLSVVLRDWLDSVSDDARFTLPSLEGLTAKTLAKVAQYLKTHAGAGTDSRIHGDGAADDSDVSPNSSRSPTAEEKKDLKQFDAAFIDDVDQAMLYDLIMAANYLAIEGLLDLGCKRVGAMIMGRTPEQVRHAFHIKNDFTADQEAEIRRASPWLFGN